MAHRRTFADALMRAFALDSKPTRWDALALVVFLAVCAGFYLALCVGAAQ